MRALRILFGTLVLFLGLATGAYFFLPGLTLALAERVELRAAGLERASIEIPGYHVVYLAGGKGEPLMRL